MKRSTLGVAQQVMLGIGIAAVFVLVVEAIQSEGHGWRFESSEDDGSYVISVRDGRDRLKVRSRGKIEYEDERRVGSIEVGARLRVEERIDGVKHVLVVTPGADGSPSCKYRVDGKVRPFDQEAETWFAGVLIRIFRQTGVYAEERVARIFQDSGVDGVLEEVTFISSDSVASTYFEHLLSTDDLSSADMQQVLRQVAESIESDHYLTGLLEGIPVVGLDDPEMADAFAAAGAKIDSDYYMRRLLASTLTGLYALEEGPSPRTVNTLLGTATRLQSDHEISQLLIHLADLHSPTLPMPENLYPLLGSIGSDWALGQTLTALLQESTLAESQARLLESGRKIQSDHEASELVIHFASLQEPGVALPDSAFELLEVIQSDHALTRAAEALGAVCRPDDVPRLLSSASIDSDFESRSLIAQLIDTHGAVIASHPDFERFVDAISSDFEQQQIREQLEAARDRDGARPASDSASGIQQASSPVDVSTTEPDGAEAESEPVEEDASDPGESTSGSGESTSGSGESVSESDQSVSKSDRSVPEI